MKTVKLISLFLAILVFVWTIMPSPLMAQETQSDNQTPLVLRHEELPKPGILPTSPFYFLKRLGENIVTFFTFGEGKKAARYFELATRRLAEAEELVVQGKLDKAPTAFQEYEKTLNKTRQQIEKAELTGLDLSKLAEKILTILPIEKQKEVTKNESAFPSGLEKSQDVVATKTPEPSRAEEALKAAAEKILTKRQTKLASPTSVSYQGSDKFGFCDGFGNRKSDNINFDIQDTKALGFLWGRPLGDVFAQETVEKNGAYDFSVPDKIVKEMQSSGIKIFGTLFPTGIPKIPNSIDATSFSKYVKTIVERYKGQITYWQVGIEPFCSTPGDTCYKNFFELTKAAYQAVKSVDSSIKISPGGPAPIYDMNSRIDPMGSAIFGYFFKNGGADYMDFFNFHYLVGKEEPSISKYVQYWKQYVGEKEIWLSETGSRDVGDRYTISSDEDKEAEWVKKHITEAFQNGISKIFWCRAEHSFSDMPKVVQTLQVMARQYNGVPSGSVAKRQSGKQQMPAGQQQPSQQSNGQQFQQSEKQQQFQQPNEMQQQRNMMQQQQQQQQQRPQQQPGNMQPGGAQQPGGGFQQPGNGFKQAGEMRLPDGQQSQGYSQGYCGDNQCDSIEQQTGGCPQDCQ